MKKPNESKRLLLVELNEFSVDLFRKGIKELALPNIRKLLAMNATSTKTDDLVEHRGLDPWVQWVSVHTGAPSSNHGIIHLGDAPARLRMKQLWETLSEKGVTSGVWGAMNATRNNAHHCSFFMPDPWTFSEDAHPEKLNALLSLPRYYSKNYLDVSPSEFLKRTLILLKFLLGSSATLSLVKQTPLILSGLLRNGINNGILFSLFDLASTAIFIEQKRKHNPNFSLVFLNSIAHLQHHRWKTGGQLPSDMKFGLQVIDRVLGMLFSTMTDGEALIVMNALTQKNIENEAPRICYRQINPAKFLQDIGLKYVRVEQLMTNDAHVFFENGIERQQAADELGKVEVNGEKLFHAELDVEDDHKLFYQIDFWDELKTDISVEINSRRIQFFDHFEAIVARTGAHVPEGNVFSRGIELPQNIYNHEVAENIFRYFDIDLKRPMDRLPQGQPSQIAI